MADRPMIASQVCWNCKNGKRKCSKELPACARCSKCVLCGEIAVSVTDPIQTALEVRIRLDGGQSTRLSGTAQSFTSVFHRGPDPTIVTLCFSIIVFSVTWLPKNLRRRSQSSYPGPVHSHCQWRKCAVSDSSLLPDHRCLAPNSLTEKMHREARKHHLREQPRAFESLALHVLGDSPAWKFEWDQRDAN